MNLKILTYCSAGTEMCDYDVDVLFRKLASLKILLDLEICISLRAFFLCAMLMARITIKNRELLKILGYVPLMPERYLTKLLLCEIPLH